jgi:hypothetical protein
MRPSSFRTTFHEALCDVCDLAANPARSGEFRWTVDYISRSPKWYRFRGQGHGGRGVSEARVLDVDCGRVTDISASLLTFAMLEFEANGLIAAYNGPRLPVVCIAHAVASEASSTAEIVEISIEQMDDGERFPAMKAATSLVFFGFERSGDVSKSCRAQLAQTREMVSPHWYRNRHMLASSSHRWHQTLT